MISKIEVWSLKSIDYLELNCKKLNIITGTNSSGKSTLLQAILLFFQTHEALNASSKPASSLNGRFVSLGEFRENKNYNTADDFLEVKIIFNQFKNCHGRIGCDEEGMYSQVDDCDHWSENTIREIHDEILNNESTCILQYLSCNRIGANDVFPKNYDDTNIGINGEYAIHYLNKHQKDTLDTDLIKDNSSETLLAQVNYWLKYIVNSTVSTEDIKGTDIIKASYKVGERRETRPKNIGSGVSYLISMIVLCLSAQKDNMLIIENPEIHLHPKAQSRVCEFLYFVAKSGIQIFVETHSDHIFNGIRAGIVTEEVDKEDVAINFFSIDESGCTKNTVVEFGKRGKILNYEKDLFDQFDLDLNKILGL